MVNDKQYEKTDKLHYKVLNLCSCCFHYFCENLPKLFSAKQVESLNEFSIPSFQSQLTKESATQKAKLSLLIKSKSEFENKVFFVNLLKTFFSATKFCFFVTITFA